MKIKMASSTFLVNKEKGKVSALLIRPPDASHLLVLGHGASSPMRHPTLETIAQQLAEVRIATFRYQFPYMERSGGGRGGRDSKAVTLATVRAAVKAARNVSKGLPLLAGGHSFGGRMTSLAAAETPLEQVKGLIFFGFPLHPPEKPGIERAEHLKAITVPMLFLSGDRDKLAALSLLRPVCRKLKKKASLHVLETADHGFKILKRTRKNKVDVFAEMARAAKEWALQLR